MEKKSIGDVIYNDFSYEKKGFYVFHIKGLFNFFNVKIINRTDRNNRQFFPPFFFI